MDSFYGVVAGDLQLTGPVYLSLVSCSLALLSQALSNVYHTTASHNVENRGHPHRNGPARKRCARKRGWRWKCTARTSRKQHQQSRKHSIQVLSRTPLPQLSLWHQVPAGCRDSLPRHLSHHVGTSSLFLHTVVGGGRSSESTPRGQVVWTVPPWSIPPKPKPRFTWLLVNGRVLLTRSYLPFLGQHHRGQCHPLHLGWVPFAQGRWMVR